MKLTEICFQHATFTLKPRCSKNAVVKNLSNL